MRSKFIASEARMICAAVGAFGVAALIHFDIRLHERLLNGFGTELPAVLQLHFRVGWLPYAGPIAAVLAWLGSGRVPVLAGVTSRRVTAFCVVWTLASCIVHVAAWSYGLWRLEQPLFCGG